LFYCVFLLADQTRQQKQATPLLVARALSVRDPSQVPLNFGTGSKGNSLPRSSSDEDADDVSFRGFCATSFDQQ